MELRGTNGHTVFHELLHCEIRHVPFVTNKTDVFIVHLFHMGVSMTIIIEHVDRGYDQSLKRRIMFNSVHILHFGV